MLIDVNRCLLMIGQWILYHKGENMALKRLTVLMDESLKSNLDSYAKIHGHTLAYIINKLVLELLKGNKNGKQQRKPQTKFKGAICG